MLREEAGANAKANASQGIPEMLEIAAANGWYRYNSRFAMPIV